MSVSLLGWTSSHSSEERNDTQKMQSRSLILTPQNIIQKTPIKMISRSPVKSTAPSEQPLSLKILEKLKKFFSSHNFEKVVVGNFSLNTTIISDIIDIRIARAMGVCLLKLSLLTSLFVIRMLSLEPRRTS